MKLPVATVALLVAGCETGETAMLTARVDQLERQVADMQKRDHSDCAHVWNIDVSPNTPFPMTVAFATGASTVTPADRITITEVRGTRERIEVGGIYLVRGEYTLGSVDTADLSLTVTASQRGEGCTDGNARGHQKIVRGTGKFELATPMVYEGKPHVWFDNGQKPAPSVYFDNAAVVPM